MLDVARKRLETEGLLSRTHIHVGELKSLPEGPPFDGAQMMGILHHVEGDAARLELLREVARRLKPGAPLVIGCRVGKDPVLTDVEFRRLRAHGIPKEELDHRRKLFDAKVTPIESDAALAGMLGQAGFTTPKPLFVSLQFKVFLTQSGTASQG
jgi:tRNA (cmo5U34)-methyltransferase